MAILTEADKSIYFPDVCQTDDALTGLIRRAENFVQSGLGSDRPLQRQQFIERKDWGQFAGLRQGLAQQWSPHQAGLWGRNGHYGEELVWLANFPVELEDPAPVVRYKGMDRSWGRSNVLDWQTLDTDSYEITADGRLTIASANTIASLEVTYTAGFDFEVESSDVINIKIATGMVLTRLARTDPDATKNQDLTLEPFQEWIESVLNPVQRYRRRVGIG